MPLRAPLAGRPVTDDLYRCALCGKLYVVPSLARACEQRHEWEWDRAHGTPQTTTEETTL